MFVRQEVCSRTLFAPSVYTWLSEIRHILQVRPLLWFTGSPPMALNIAVFHTSRLCASVSVVRAVPGDLCAELKGTFVPPCRVCMGAAAGCCVGVGSALHRMTLMSISGLLSKDWQPTWGTERLVTVTLLGEESSLYSTQYKSLQLEFQDYFAPQKTLWAWFTCTNQEEILRLPCLQLYMAPSNQQSLNWESIKNMIGSLISLWMDMSGVIAVFL